MTISTETCRIGYSGNGSTKNFTIPFDFADESYLLVLLVGSDGVSATQVLDTDYTVDMGTPKITMTTAPASGESVWIYRDSPMTQESDYQTGDRFPAETLESDLDYRAKVEQELRQAIDLCVQMPLSTSETFDGRIPEPIRPGYMLKLKGDGTGWEWIAISTTFPTVTGTVTLNYETRVDMLTDATGPSTWDDGQLIQTFGCLTVNDGGHGLYQWDATNVNSDNGVSILLPSGHVGAGRLLLAHNGVLDVRQAAAKVNGVDDDSQAFLDCWNALLDVGGTVTFPDGCAIENTVFPSSDATIVMRGLAGMFGTSVTALGTDIDDWAMTFEGAAATGLANVELRDFSINGTGTDTPSYCGGIYVQPSNQLFVHRVRARFLRGPGFRFERAHNSYLSFVCYETGDWTRDKACFILTGDQTSVNPSNHVRFGEVVTEQCRAPARIEQVLNIQGGPFKWHGGPSTPHLLEMTGVAWSAMYDHLLTLGVYGNWAVRIIDDQSPDYESTGTPVNVTGATQANPVVITSSTHGLSNGDEVLLENLGGMTELNDRYFVIAGVTTNTFELYGEDGTGHTAYTSGGTATEVGSHPFETTVLSTDRTRLAMEGVTLINTYNYYGDNTRFDVMRVDIGNNSSGFSLGGHFGEFLPGAASGDYAYVNIRSTCSNGDVFERLHFDIDFEDVDTTTWFRDERTTSVQRVGLHSREWTGFALGTTTVVPPGTADNGRTGELQYYEFTADGSGYCPDGELLAVRTSNVGNNPTRFIHPDRVWSFQIPASPTGGAAPGDTVWGSCFSTFSDANNAGLKAQITLVEATFFGADPLTITGATQANPVVITSAGHGLSNGYTVLIEDVVGMTEINDRTFTVANVTTDTFELSGEDGTGHTAYSSGGTATAQWDADASNCWTLRIHKTTSTYDDYAMYAASADRDQEVNGMHTLLFWTPKTNSTFTRVTWPRATLFKTGDPAISAANAFVNIHVQLRL